MEGKSKLREEVQRKAASLPPHYLNHSAEEICRTVLNLEEYKRAGAVFSFVGRPFEINTKPIIEDALMSGKILCAPKCIAKGVMDARQILDFDDLEEARLGLLEPKDSCKVILPSEIDFALIPCVSCDMSGHRLGFGGGYYDRYLRETHFFKCVICRQELILENVPWEAHDVIPDLLVTETCLIRF